MNTSTYFRDWFFNTYKPCGVVYTSEKAKKLIKKNNISPADFLRPLGDFQGRQISYPYNDKENISIPNFHFDFYDNDKFKKIERDKILQYITTMFDYNQPKWDLSTPTVNKYNFEPYLHYIKYNSTIWYREFEKTLFECLKFDDYECLQQPLISIFICCVDDQITVIKDELGKNPPKLIYDGRYDIPRENIIILINDKNADTTNNAEDNKDKETNSNQNNEKNDIKNEENKNKEESKNSTDSNNNK